MKKNQFAPEYPNKLTPEQIKERDRLQKEFDEINQKRKLAYRKVKNSGVDKDKIFEILSKDAEYQKINKERNVVYGKLSKYISKPKYHGYVLVSYRE